MQRNKFLFLPIHFKPFVMKRLLLFVLVLTGLSAVAQNNIVLEQFKDMPLKMHCADLYFGEAYKAPGSHLLTDEELMTLLGTDMFDQYASGRSLFYAGRTLKTIGWVAFSVGLANTALMYIAWDDNVSGFLNDPLTMVSVGTVFEGIGAVIVGKHLYRPGKEKLEEVLAQYNEDKPNVTFNLSPSIMKCYLPQNQSQTTLGLTFSVDF